MNTHLKNISLSMICGAISLAFVSADPAAPEAKPAKPAEVIPDAKKAEEPETPKFETTDTEIKFSGITIVKATKEVKLDAEVCLDKGLLEYVVCRPDTFEHESIFTTKTNPELVHAALLISGLKPTPLHHGLTALWSDKAMKEELSRVKIEVEWEEDGKKKRENLTSMLRNREDADDGYTTPDPKAPIVDTKIQDAWIFTGSFIHVDEKTKKQLYAAKSSGILVGIWPDPSTVIQYGIASGDPYAAEHLGMAINEDKIPKVGTKVKLIFSKLTLPEAKAEEKSEPKK